MSFSLSRKIMAVLFAAVLILSLASCSDDEPPHNPFDGGSSSGSSGGSSLGIMETFPANGFSPEMVKRFGFGTNRPGDFLAYFGQPISRDDDEISRCVTLNYPGAKYQFDGVGDTAVLFYVLVTDPSIVGPNGIKVGMELREAADLIYGGAGEMIGDTAGYTLYFYGTDDASHYGLYRYPDVEYSSGDYVHELVFRCTDQEGKRIDFLMAFDTNQLMVSYTISRDY